MKKTLLLCILNFIFFLSEAQIVSIRPDSAGLNQTLATTITAANGVFAMASPPYNTNDIFLQQGGSQIHPDAYDIITNYYQGTDSIWVNFTIPSNANPGFYDVHVITYGFIPFPPYYGPFDNVLTNGFRVLNCIAPSAVITSGSTTMCASGPGIVLFANTSAGYLYQWLLNGNPINGATNSSYTANGGGEYSCQVRNSCTTSISNSIFINVVSTPSANISASGPPSICAPGGVRQLIATYNSSYTYQWQVNGGNIPSATSYFYNATAAGTYTCLVTNSCGTITTNLITITSVSGSPTSTIIAGGSTTFCQGGSVVLSVNASAGSNYVWRRNGNSPAPGVYTNTTYTATLAGVYDCVVSNACGSSTSTTITIIVNTSPAASISASGSTNTCSTSGMFLTAAFVAGNSYQWLKDGVNIPNATQNIYTPVASGIYRCSVSNTCGSSLSNSITVTVTQPAVASILPAGTAGFCQGGFVNFSATTGTGYSYQWRLNTVAIGGATSSTYAANQAGSYTCAVTNSCGTVISNATSISLTSAPTISINASGSTALCNGATVQLDAVSTSGQSHQWYNGASPIGGATGTSYLASASGTYTCVVTNSCGSSTSNGITVSANSTPAASISAAGSTAICPGFNVTLNAQTSAGASYQWNLNGNTVAGATNASYIASVAGAYTCTVSNSCGSSTSNTINVSTGTSPVIPGTITGQASGVCSSVKTYSISAVASATSYAWTVPAGVTLNSGQGSLSITVTFSGSFNTGTISVASVNSCGTSGTRSLTVTGAPSAPGTITGSTAVCRHARVTYSVQAVPGATSYTWTAPRQASIVSGQGTLTAVIKWGTTSGPVSVKASNSCGTGIASSLNVNIVCKTTEEIFSFEPLIFPNPSASKFTLRIADGEMQVVSLSLYDMTGRKCFYQEKIQADEEFNFGEELHPGIYIADILLGEEHKFIRIVKEN